MLKIYNKRAVTRQERFQNALVAGIIATFLITLVYGFLSSILMIEFSIVYLAAGYGIGYAILKYGRGVQVQFSILAAVLAVICFIMGDMISLFGFSILVEPGLWGFGFQLILTRLLSTSINSLLALAFRVGGVIIAYQTARLM